MAERSVGLDQFIWLFGTSHRKLFRCEDRIGDGKSGLGPSASEQRLTAAEEESDMLVLSRQRDETIMIGDDIEITIVDIRGDKVRIGISAPTEIPVHRKEVYEAIRRENKQAAKLNGEIQMIGKQIQSGSQRTAARSRAAQLARPIRTSSPSDSASHQPQEIIKRTGS